MTFTEPHSWPPDRNTTTLCSSLSSCVALTDSHERLISPSFVFICMLLGCLKNEAEENSSGDGYFLLARVGASSVYFF